MIWLPDWEAGEEIGGVPFPFYDEQSGYARLLIANAGLDGNMIISGRRMLVALDLPRKRVAPVEVAAWSYANGICIPTTTPPHLLDHRIAYEVTRWHMIHLGVSANTQTPQVHQVRLCWQMPDEACMAICCAAGDFMTAIPVLLRFYEGLHTPEVLLARAAQACDVLVKIHPLRRDPYLVIPPATEDNWHDDDEDDVAMAEETREEPGRVLHDGGLKALTFPVPGYRELGVIQVKHKAPRRLVVSREATRLVDEILSKKYG